MKILMLTSDEFLYKKVYLELFGIHSLTDDSSIRDASVLIYDCESGIPLPDFCGKIIKLSRYKNDGAYLLPLHIGRLEKLISGTDMPRLSLSPDGKYAVLDGKAVKLTSHEYALLSLLICGGKSYTSREKIASEVWDNAKDGLINIYIHYLREKLESGGEKIIISSRKLGYKINEKYLGGTVC